MSKYESLADLPLTLSANDISEVLGLSKAGIYNLFKSPNFPVLKIGKRKVVPRDKFVEWIERHTENNE